MAAKTVDRLVAKMVEYWGWGTVGLRAADLVASTVERMAVSSADQSVYCTAVERVALKAAGMVY